MSTTIRLVSIALTLLCLGAQPFLPPIINQLLPNPKYQTTLYSDDTWGGKSNASWVDRESAHWHCSLVQSEFFPVCGLAISFDRGPDKTIDFSRYHSIRFSLKYKGEAPKLRLYLRNHNPSYSDLNDNDSFKFNALNIPSKALNSGVTTIKLSEFSVAEWWLDERNIDREHSAPEITNIVAMGIDFPSPHVFGQHDIDIESIELVGERVHLEKLAALLLIGWMLLLSIEVGLTHLKSQAQKKRP